MHRLLSPHSRKGNDVPTFPQHVATIGNFTCSNWLASLSLQPSTTPAPFGLWAMTASVQILYTSSTQMQELIGTTMPIIKESPSLPSVTNNHVHIGTTTKHVSESQGNSGEETIRAPTSHRQEHFYSRNAGSSTTNIRTLNFYDPSLLLSFPLLPTYLVFPHSLS